MKKESAGRHFIERGRTLEEIQMLTKELQKYSDDELRNVLINLQDKFYDDFGGVRYKQEAKVLDNKIKLISEHLLMREAKRMGIL